MASIGVLLWFLISIPVVLYDLTYVLLRPRSMPGGDLSWFWEPYILYCKHDGRYKDVTNDWVLAQSWGNIVEVVIALFALLLLKNKKQRALVLFSVALMTFWKTVLYFVVEICSDYKYTKQSTPYEFLTMFFLPSFVWILGPVYVMYATGSELLSSSHNGGSSSKGKKQS